MTWQSGICSKLLAVVCSVIASGPAQPAGLTGAINLVQAKDTMKKRASDFSGVVVWLTADSQTAARGSPKHAQMIQKNKKFVPHILPIQVGATVEFPNLDPIFHNAFSNYDGQMFDVALYPPGSSRAVKFQRPGIVRVFCNIHSSMSAIIVVLDSGYFTVTDSRGRYSFANLDPGKYQLHFFYERATADALEKLTQTIDLGETTKELASAAITETGYLPVAHKNKYGQDYPAGDNTDGSYTYSSRMK